MADEPRAEEEEQEHETPAEHVGDRAFRRVGPGGVMDHTAMMGTLDTTDTGGTYGPSELEKLAPIFRVARAHDAAVAARALDPEDDSVREDQVTVSQGISIVQGDPEADKKRVLENAKLAQQRLDGEDTEFDPNFRAHFDRRAQAEAAWVASMSGMQPGLVVGGNDVLRPAPPAEEDMQAAQERQAAQETVLTPEPKTELPQQPESPEQEQEPEQGTAADNPIWKATMEAAQRQREAARQQGELQGGEKTEEKAEVPKPPANRPRVKAPNKASSKAEWVEWALQCDPTLSREDAEAMHRTKLIEQYDKYRDTK